MMHATLDSDGRIELERLHPGWRTDADVGLAVFSLTDVTHRTLGATRHQEFDTFGLSKDERESKLSAWRCAVSRCAGASA